MARRKESIFDIFTEITWQTSVTLAVIVFVTIRFILPLIPMQGYLPAEIVETLRRHAHLIGLVLLVPAPFSAHAARKRKKRLAAQKEMHSIGDLDRWQVEQLVAETYRRRGYTVMAEQGGRMGSPADLRMQKGGRLYLLQCRHWHAVTVNVSDVRELWEGVSAEGAAGGIVIASGSFTPDAKRFAAAKPIQLIGLEQLAAFTGDR